MSTEVIVSLVSTAFGSVLGWFLSTFTRFSERRSENRKALSKAIADLLEIRYRLVSESMCMEEVRRIAALTPQDERQVRAMLTAIWPRTVDISKRFDDTVTLIASVDPILGYQLRYKDFVLRSGMLFTNLEAQAGAPFPPFTDLEQKLWETVIPQLNDLILSLSLRHGLWTWFRVRRSLKRIERPKELDDVFGAAKAAMEQLQRVAAQASAAQAKPGVQNAAPQEPTKPTPEVAPSPA